MSHLLASFYLFYIINARIYGGVVLSAHSDLTDNVSRGTSIAIRGVFQGSCHLFISLTLTIPGIKKSRSQLTGVLPVSVLSLHYYLSITRQSSSVLTSVTAAVALSLLTITVTLHL